MFGRLPDGRAHNHEDAVAPHIEMTFTADLKAIQEAL
jgi:hypothetical protein